MHTSDLSPPHPNPLPQRRGEEKEPLYAASGVVQAS
jgi:hypothetical protein